MRIRPLPILMGAPDPTQLFRTSAFVSSCLEAVSINYRELMTYYKETGGKKMDSKILLAADESVKGSGDGRISKQDAEKILAAVIDGGKYTDIEKESVEFIQKNYRWTEAASEWFSEQLATWRTYHTTPIKMTPAELSRQQFSTVDVLTNEADRELRNHGLRSATNETYLDHDDITLIVRLADGMRVEVTTNFIELAGQFVELKGGNDIPLKAIEKIEI